MSKLENMTKAELIALVKELQENQHYNHGYNEYEEEILQEEINRYDARLEEMGYIDCGYGVGCYGPM